ncbi:DUF4388 domain-containing protein [Myxococcota bacterium]|nr:DUF4388 domain-containing protein [Myxococcota bacterium]
MALRGQIEDFGIADLFQLIVQGGKSGFVTFSDDIDEIRVAFKDGWIVGAENTQRPGASELASRLATLGVITGAQLGRVLKTYAETEEPVARILVEGHYAPLEIVRQLATLQALDLLFEVFTWPAGAYAFEESWVDGAPPWFEPISTDFVLINGIELVDEWPRIQETIPSHQLKVVRVRDLEPRRQHAALVDDLVMPSELVDEIGDIERHVFELCRPGNVVKTVLERMPTSRFEAARGLSRLVRGGFVRLE